MRSATDSARGRAAADHYFHFARPGPGPEDITFWYTTAVLGEHADIILSLCNGMRYCLDGPRRRKLRAAATGGNKLRESGRFFALASWHCHAKLISINSRCGFRRIGGGSKKRGDRRSAEQPLALCARFSGHRAVLSPSRKYREGGGGDRIRS